DGASAEDAAGVGTRTGARAGGERAGGDASADAERERGTHADARTPASDEPAATDDAAGADTPATAGAGKFRAPTENATLDAGNCAGDDGARREFASLPAMRVLGQFRETYVVAETDEGLVLVDQHAADERVAYERLAAELAGDPASQRLVEPADLDVTPGEAAVFDAVAADVRALGFEATREEQTVRVTAVPAVLSDQLDPGLVADLLAEFLAGADPDVDAAADELLADMACYPAITGNTSLAEGSVVALLEALDDCENPWACPHGRPVVVELSETELADRFERDYPGHRGRRPEG
ncbi:MAG: DNA mismatch repair protein MutL, partial [Halobacteriaceae archaeon]